MTSKLLTSSDIEAIIIRHGLNQVMKDLIERLREGFIELDLDSAQIPTRSGLHYSNPDLGLIEWMPANTNKGDASLKLVGYHPSNPHKRNLPTVISSICLFDTSSGHLKGLLDGTFLTALRTGAMSALATGILAKKDSTNLGVIGCGAQAVTQVHALSSVMDIGRVMVYDKDPNAAASLQSRIAFLDIPIEIYSRNNLTELLKNADVLCTCTSEEPGTGPLFKNFKAQPHLHINAVGSDFPDKIELPIELLREAFVCPDFLEQAMIEGECQQLNREQIFGDISKLLKQPKTSEAQRGKLTVFDSTGHAFADYVTSNYFMDLAEKFGLGREVEIECLPSDPKNPYSFLTTPPKNEIREVKELSKKLP